MRELLDMTIEELRALLTSLGEPTYRAAQIWKSLCCLTRFEEMTNLPLSLRARLRAECQEGYCRLEKRLVSVDGTRKYLVSFADGEMVECVLMEYEYGRTICISTQVGCPMGCAFCASTKGGLVRNLSAGEMMAQVLAVNEDAGGERSISNIVLMGSGEPLMNYDNVVKFLRLINAPYTLNVGFRGISLSTCGLPEKMRRFAAEKIPVTVCLSLHAAIEEKRRQVMPVAKQYSIEETLLALDECFRATGRRVIIEYILIDGFNDTEEDIRALGKLLSNRNCHVNLIPYNGEGPFHATNRKDAHDFAKRLAERGVLATVRRTLGADILGACGQLRGAVTGG